MSKTYQEKLLDRRWQEKKSKIMERDKFQCQNHNCTSQDNSTLHVHHLYYLWHDPWDVTDDMLTTLCDKCHKEEDERWQLERHLAMAFLMKGFLSSDLIALATKLHSDKNFTTELLKTIRKYQNG